MRLEDNLVQVKEYNHAALEGDLVCDCKNETFFIFHTGVQKKRLFGSPILKKKEKQIVIKAKCSHCSKEYVLYDSTLDSSHSKGQALEHFEVFTTKSNSPLLIRMLYNFFPENFKTDLYEMVFIEAKEINSQKFVRIYEE